MARGIRAGSEYWKWRFKFAQRIVLGYWTTVRVSARPQQMSGGVSKWPGVFCMINKNAFSSITYFVLWRLLLSESPRTPFVGQQLNCNEIKTKLIQIFLIDFVCFSVVITGLAVIWGPILSLDLIYYQTSDELRGDTMQSVTS